MRISWKRGFLRMWTLLALAWVIFFGWRQYSVETQWTDPGIHVGGECYRL